MIARNGYRVVVSVMILATNKFVVIPDAYRIRLYLAIKFQIHKKVVARIKNPTRTFSRPFKLDFSYKFGGLGIIRGISQTHCKAIPANNRPVLDIAHGLIRHISL